MVLPGFSFIVFLLFSCFATSSHVLKVGADKITVTQSYYTTFQQGTDSSYKTIMVKLYHAPISQVDRAWRKTVDGLEKDETCQFNIVAKLYSPSNNSFIWIIERDISTATYFVRAHAYNSADEEIAFGQSINFRPSCIN